LLYGCYFSFVIQLTRMPDPFEGLNIVAYGDRGWCSCEEIMSGLIKPSGQLLNLGESEQYLDNRQGLDAVLPSLVTSRKPPMHPDTFAEHLQTKTFTNGNDCEMVAGIYRSFFACVTTRADVLRLCKLGPASELGWRNAEIVQLALALPKFEKCILLDLSGHAIGDDGMGQLAPCLPRMPSLQDLSFAACQFGGPGLQALLQVLPDCSSLKRLKLPSQLKSTHVGLKLEESWQQRISSMRSERQRQGAEEDGPEVFLEWS